MGKFLKEGSTFEDGRLITRIKDEIDLLTDTKPLNSKRLIGRASASTGSPEEISIGTGLALSDAGVLSCTVSGGSGTVTSVGISGANGIGVSSSPVTSSGTIALSLGAITPSSVSASGTVAGSNLSGTNTGDQTITLTGDVTGSGTGSFATTLNIGGITEGDPALADFAAGRSAASAANRRFALDRIGGLFNPSVNGFRFSIVDGQSVPTSDTVTGVTTIYLIPHVGNRIALYDGIRWQLLASSGVSFAPIGLSADTTYDVFAFISSGAIALEITAWSSAITRATALTTQDSILVRSGAVTRRYLGSIRTTGSSQFVDTAGIPFVWNWSNQVKRPVRVLETTGSWTYSSSTWRQARATTSNRIQTIVGVHGSVVDLLVRGKHETTSLVDVGASIGVDSTTTPATGVVGGTIPLSAASAYGAQNSRLVRYAPVGLVSWNWLERGGGSGTQTHYGQTESGMSGWVEG